MALLGDVGVVVGGAFNMVARRVLTSNTPLPPLKKGREASDIGHLTTGIEVEDVDDG